MFVSGFSPSAHAPQYLPSRLFIRMWNNNDVKLKVKNIFMRFQIENDKFNF